MDERITRQRICAIADLPEPSVMLMNLIPLLAAEDADVDRLATEIGRDQALVARILKLVNSSYFHLKRKVDSVKSAIMLLGLVNIRQVVYSAVCFDYFPQEEHDEWSHAYTTSLLISELMRNKYIPAGGCLQLTALLHDIGKFIFRRKAPQKYRCVLRKSQGEMLPLHEVEKSFFECDHAEVGGWLLEAWDMSEDIVVPVKSHHSDALPSKYSMDAAILRVADWMDASARGASLPQPPPELLAAAGIYDIDLRLLRMSQEELISGVEREQLVPMAV